MGILGFLKGIIDFVDFNNFKKDDYYPFKKMVTDKLSNVDELDHKIAMQKHIFNNRSVRKIIENQYHIIDLVFDRIIKKFQELPDNERNFAVFLRIQQQSIDKYYGEDFEEQHCLMGSNTDLLELVRESMMDPVIWLKRVRVPELREIFETYDKPNRKQYITERIMGYCEDLKDKFYDAFKKHRDIIQMYS